MSLSIVAGAPRDISAPHQTSISGNEYATSRGMPTHVGKGKVNGVTAPSDAQIVNAAAFTGQNYPNYRTFQFQPLEPVGKVVYDKYVGPTPESNWVVPGKLLVGAYPASADDAETLDLITSILRNGVTKFVCLQQEYREHGVTEAMWRSGQALRPYFEDVRAIVRKKHLIPCLAGHNVVSEQRLSFTHFPIRDCSVTDDDRVLELAYSLVRCIAEGHTIYLHCWGGHGRTGTLVCIMLHLMYGMDDKEAMEYCQTVHDLRQCPVVVGSPQTQTQRDQVSRVIHSCFTLNKLQQQQQQQQQHQQQQQQQALSVPRDDAPSLPSPVARSGEKLESKLGSPRSATKLPVASPSIASGNSQNPNGSEQVAQCLGAAPMASPGSAKPEVPTPSQSQSQPQPEDTGSDEEDMATDDDMGEGEDEDEGGERGSDLPDCRMRLGTMDESDMCEEVAGAPVADLSADGGRLSLEDGEIQGEEQPEPGQSDMTGDGEQAEAAEEEVRGADTVAAEPAVSGTALPPNEPEVAKPSFRPLWGGRKTAQ